MIEVTEFYRAVVAAAYSTKTTLQEAQLLFRIAALMNTPTFRQSPYAVPRIEANYIATFPGKSGTRTACITPPTTTAIPSYRTVLI
ncbi:MAG: hypothetical protein ACOY15_11725 [Pseudomonadota bacterium]